MVDTSGLNPDAGRRAGSSPAGITVGWAGARPILIRWACHVQLVDLQLMAPWWNMVDTSVLGTDAERRVGSTPTGATKLGA